MPSVDPADAGPCATCGRPWAEVDGGSRWLHLEVTRDDGAGCPDFLDADFCSQEHAAEWLDEPLPEREPSTPLRLDWRGRLAATGVGLSFGAVAGLTTLGLVTAVRWVVQLF